MFFLLDEWQQINFGEKNNMYKLFIFVGGNISVNSIKPVQLYNTNLYCHLCLIISALQFFLEHPKLCKTHSKTAFIIQCIIDCKTSTMGVESLKSFVPLPDVFFAVVRQCTGLWGNSVFPSLKNQPGMKSTFTWCSIDCHSSPRTSLWPSTTLLMSSKDLQAVFTVSAVHLMPK